MWSKCCGDSSRARALVPRTYQRWPQPQTRRQQGQRIPPPEHFLHHPPPLVIVRHPKCIPITNPPPSPSRPFFRVIFPAPSPAASLWGPERGEEVESGEVGSRILENQCPSTFTILEGTLENLCLKCGERGEV